MNLTEFIWQLDDTRIVQAIRAAERASSVEIRVYVCECPVSDPVAAAEYEFEALGMARTKLRNAVLVFVAPLTQKLAIVGDSGANTACGPAVWLKIVNEMAAIVKESPTDALVHGIRQIGRHMSGPFPRQADDVNELPDFIERE